MHHNGQPYWFLITVDVEDWFQVENFKDIIDISSWDDLELRVERNVQTLLDLLDASSASLKGPNMPAPVNKPSTTNRELKGTFFILGWIARKLPHLVRTIHARGHEIASHGFNHDLCHAISLNRLQQDITDSKKLLEDIIGDEVTGYRAPSFSINNDAIRVIRDAGYQYDSSYNSFAMNERYGSCDQCVHSPPEETIIPLGKNFFELPISNMSVSKWVLPWGGGGYFRMLPPAIFQKGVARILKKKGAYVFYLHPWELDPGQPKVQGASWRNRFRHYLNLSKTGKRIQSLIHAFRGCRFMTCTDFLQHQGYLK